MCHKYKTHPLFCFKEYNYPKLLSVPALGTLIVICWVIKPLSSASTADTQKKGSAETTLPHGLDELYNHLSHDILFCVCCLVGRVKEHSARTYASLILMLLLTSAVILHYIAVTIIVGSTFIAHFIREIGRASCRERV